MGHTLMIVLHATGGTVAFVAGVLALLRPRPGALARLIRYAHPVNQVGLVVMLVGLVAAIALDWAGLGTAPRVLFVGFAVLAVVMVALSFRAARIRPAPGTTPRPAYVGLVGFNLIALFDGFVVVLVLDLVGSGWWAAVAGLLGAVAGNRTLAVVKRRAHPAAPAQPAQPNPSA